MRRHSLPAITSIMLCITLTLVAHQDVLAQQSNKPPTWQLYLSGQYVEYLHRLDETLGKLTQESQKHSLSYVVPVAIALDKTNQWDTDVAKQAETLVALYPDTARYFQAVKRLVRGDVSGLSLFFEGTPPSYDSWRGQIQQLRQQGYTSAADAFTALYMTGSTGIGTPQGGKVIEEGLTSLAALTPDQRKAVVDVIVERLKSGDNWYGQGQIVQAAKRLLLKADAADADAYVEIAAKFDNGSSFLDVNTMRSLFSTGKIEAAATMAMHACDAYPGQVEQLCVVGNLLAQYADAGAASTYYKRALSKAPKPQVRDIRLQYLQWLSEKRGEEELRAAVGQLGPVASVDEQLVKGKLQEAAQGYAKVVWNNALSLDQRLDGLAGWLTVNPDDATNDAEKMIAQVKTAENAPDLLRWLGWQLWKAAKADALQSQSASTEAVKKRTTKMAAIMEALIAADMAACFTENPQANIQSLRVPASALFALCGQPEKAAEILNRRATYKIPAPPEGWRNPPGAPAPSPADAYAPRTVTSPSSQREIARWERGVMTLLQGLRASGPVRWETNRAFTDRPLADIDKKP
jgi:hypothetical protein